MQYLSPYPGVKKIGIFLQREQELRHALRSNFSPAKTRRAAQRLKAAKFYLLKALRDARNPLSAPQPLAKKELQNIERETSLWIDKSVDTIIMEYNRTLDPPQG